MGKDLAAAFPSASDVFELADATLGFPLSRLCFEGPDEELMATRNAQPALLTHGAAVWGAVAGRVRPFVRAAAGHSLGEFTAYHAAGAFAFPDALRLVRRRGELMFESGAKRPGAMAAILGLSEANVEAACARALEEGDVEVVGRRPVQLDLGHMLADHRGGDLTERPIHRASWCGSAPLVAGVPGSARPVEIESLTSASTSSVCSPLRAAGRCTVGPVARENRTGWGSTL